MGYKEHFMVRGEGKCVWVIWRGGGVNEFTTLKLFGAF
jgi:hypothetical protein